MTGRETRIALCKSRAMQTTDGLAGKGQFLNWIGAKRYEAPAEAFFAVGFATSERCKQTRNGSISDFAAPRHILTHLRANFGHADAETARHPAKSSKNPAKNCV
jgi:hypothetical protein